MLQDSLPRSYLRDCQYLTTPFQGLLSPCRDEYCYIFSLPSTGDLILSIIRVLGFCFFYRGPNRWFGDTLKVTPFTETLFILQNCKKKMLLPISTYTKPLSGLMLIKKYKKEFIKNQSYWSTTCSSLAFNFERYCLRIKQYTSLPCNSCSFHGILPLHRLLVNFKLHNLI